MSLLDAFNSVKEDARELSVFTETAKPKSVKKTQDKQDFTPLKIKPIQKLFKTIMQLKDEIIADKTQVGIAFNASSNVTFVDQTVRILLDLPTIKMRTKFVSALRILNKYSIVFGMSLQEQLNKEYYQLKQRVIDTKDHEYLSVLGDLINKISTQKNSDAKEEFITSLIFPYLHYVLA